MAKKDVKPRSSRNADAEVERNLVSRRLLLKGSVSSLPAILTLHSGAALARSSNLIGAARTASPDANGRTLCLDVDSVYPADGNPYVYDLGEPAYARVTAIHERDYRYRPRWRASGVSEAEMCQNGGTYYYRTGWSWNEAKVSKGVLVSATALSSFAGDIVISDL